MNKILLSALFLACISSPSVSAFQFEVGDEMGWRKPTAKDRQTYNEWAAHNRFHIGDSLDFKYGKDSVLVVRSADYSTCNTSNPVAKFGGGGAVYEFPRSGLFYFISGLPGHCSAGQRLIVRVMHPSQVSAPDIAPSPPPVEDSGASGGGDSAQPGVSSAATLSVVSFFVSVFAALVLVFV